MPAHFRCAINGHSMQDPVAHPDRPSIVFERATIEAWLSQSGTVCPITGEVRAAWKRGK